MLSKKHKRQSGFTIIEVLIVLAIAGLIMLIVFLAVPALQRNARNTQRRHDISSLLGGMSEYVNNNNGALPATASNLGSGTSATIGGSGSNTVPVSLSYYDASKISVSNTAQTNGTTTDQVVIVEGAVCGGTGGNDAVAGTSRSFVALFKVENNAFQCQAS
ncbi:MAG TPA: type II secretion system protein [Candidatus Saccharimonadales bacterium]|nr:type II secretion system protein [Candidatus Saccharimonadales bacterium]